MQVNRFKSTFAEKVKNLDWLGGFFDGEGCIYFTDKAKPYKNKTYPEVQVIFAQSGDIGLALMEAIQEEYKTGKITSHHRSVLSKEVPYMTRLSGKKAVAFLKLIRSHLLLKQEKADLVINYMEVHYAS